MFDENNWNNNKTELNLYNNKILKFTTSDDEIIQHNNEILYFLNLTVIKITNYSQFKEYKIKKFQI